MSRWLGGGASASGGGYGKVPTVSSSSSGPGFSGSIQMEVGSTPSNDLVTTNHAYCSPKDALLFHIKGMESYALVGNTCVLTIKGFDGVRDGVIALSAIQRQYLKVSKGDRIPVERYTMPEKFKMVAATMEVDFVGRNRIRKEEELDAKVFSKDVIKRLANQVLTVEQKVPVEYCGVTFVLKVADLATEEENDTVTRGLVTHETTFIFESSPDSGIKITNQRGVGNQIFKHKELNFQKLGIGGLDAEFANIFRRAFASRVYPPEVISRLGISHVKGMLLHGPPGTGKTLIARQIGKMLNGREPKVVNGPEVLNKYVGQTEENIRQLFADAESDQKMRGDKSDLHIIIFDEIDAICKTRGSTRDGTGVHDSIVNQLLTKIDGVNALNNILLIGMTNRKDMLDEALLRPGRLEVQIEIGLPDEKGRVQILQIHTSRMRENSFLSPDIRVEELALRTKNFSGAELEGLVKAAVSFALDRQVDVSDLTKPIDEDNIKVTMDDFLRALDDIQPAFGAAMNTLDMYRVNGILDCGEENKHIREVAMTLVEQVKKSDRTALMTCLLEGPSGSGKTALAATIAIDSDFPFIKIISAENMIGYSEASKCSAIAKVFEDAYKSPLSIIILDDIERLLDFVDIGPRFSNVVLQAILVLLKRLPPKGRKLMVLGTTSLARLRQDEMELEAAFNVKLSVPNLRASDIKKVLDGLGVFAEHDLDSAVSALEGEIPIKSLLMLVEMAAQGKGGQDAEDVYAGRRKIDINYFYQCLRDSASR